MSIKTPRLIRGRCGVYYFRFVVPLGLRQSVGKTEFRRSLKTKDSAIARQRALALCVAVETVMTPNINDFPHLLKANAKEGIREKIVIDLPARSAMAPLARRRRPDPEPSSPKSQNIAPHSSARPRPR